MRHTDEHAYGYTVMLWQVDTCLFGLLTASQGLAGDAPIGALQDVKYDEKTKSLSFAAKLTTGMVSFNGSSGAQPARDLFAFRGHLMPTRLAGVITHVLQNTPQSRPVENTVTLVLSRDETELMHGSTTYGEWLDKWQVILRRRGPKW